MKVLGIETSCDETSAAVVSDGSVLSNIVASQYDVHERFGGVVPELASRRHLETIIPIFSQALDVAAATINDIDGLAVTSCPGLVGALLVGLSAAKGIAMARNIPFIGINHVEGHINAPWIEHPHIPLPSVALIVSGGHTSLYVVEAFGSYRLLGKTRDDAAGEAFDKVGKLLGLGFPGGPAIDKVSVQGNPEAFRFTMPRFTDASPFDFSFSGIKTAAALVLREAVQSHHPSSTLVADLAASFQSTVVDVLVSRLFEATARVHAKSVIISGGVAANRLLRRQVAKQAQEKNIPYFIPSLHYCTDNAAMIAFVGEKYLQQGKHSALNLNASATGDMTR